MSNKHTLGAMRAVDRIQKEALEIEVDCAYIKKDEAAAIIDQETKSPEMLNLLKIWRGGINSLSEQGAVDLIDETVALLAEIDKE